MIECKNMTKITSNSVALAGEFAVLSQLALRGYDANMTLGNTKSVDILVAQPNTDKMYKLEVKTNFKNSRNGPSQSKLFGEIISSWMMQDKHEKISEPNLFYCFVNIGKDTSKFRFFIIPSKVVAKYIREEHAYWLKADSKHKTGAMRLFRVGSKKNNYDLPPPFIEKWENNWEFKK